MPNPVITIAMPFYNSAATLELAIRSLLNQSYGDFELLLCDDGSDDQGLAIARSFNDPRLICWSDGRRLRLAARLNECIDRARGRYLARMDADDIAYPDRLAQQLAFLDRACGGRPVQWRRHGFRQARPALVALQSRAGTCSYHPLPFSRLSLMASALDGAHRVVSPLALR